MVLAREQPTAGCASRRTRGCHSTAAAASAAAGRLTYCANESSVIGWDQGPFFPAAGWFWLLTNNGGSGNATGCRHRN